MIDGIRASIRGDSFLARRNPAVKLLLVVGYVLVAAVLFDIATLLALWLIVLLTTWRLGRAPLTALLRGLIPFFLLGLGYVWMNAVFPRTDGTPLTIVAEIGPLQVAREGLLNGSVMLARALCFGACSLLFVATTSPTDLVASLMRQLRLSPRVAYGILAAYRFLPELHDTLGQIRAAHRLRGVGEHGGLRGRIEQTRRYTIPLLATAIRQAGRVAIAMESRGFTGARDRTFYRQPGVTPQDYLFVAAALVALVLVILLAPALGAA